VSRTGTFLPGDYLAATVFNLDGLDSKGYGGRFWSAFPFLENRLTLRAGFGVRFLETRDTDKTLAVTDLSLYADWWITRAWSVYAGTNYTFGDEVSSILFDFGADFRW
jgi:hypothetical protein